MGATDAGTAHIAPGTGCHDRPYETRSSRSVCSFVFLKRRRLCRCQPRRRTTTQRPEDDRRQPEPDDNPGTDAERNRATHRTGGRCETPRPRAYGTEHSVRAQAHAQHPRYAGGDASPERRRGPRCSDGARSQTHDYRWEDGQQKQRSHAPIMPLSSQHGAPVRPGHRVKLDDRGHSSARARLEPPL